MSQIPSGASRRARLAEQRFDRCPVCQRADVSGVHVERCEEEDRYRKAASASAEAAGIPVVTGHDLWAHLNSRTHNVLTSALVVQLVIDLGWRPVVGSDPKRLWSSSRPSAQCHNGHPFVPGVSADHAPGESDPRWCNTCGEASRLSSVQSDGGA